MCAGYADSQMNSDHTKGGGGWGEGDTTGPHREKCIQALVPHQVGIGNRLPVWMGGTGTVMGTDKTDTGRDRSWENGARFRTGPPEHPLLLVPLGG